MFKGQILSKHKWRYENLHKMTTKPLVLSFGTNIGNTWYFFLYYNAIILSSVDHWSYCHSIIPIKNTKNNHSSY